MRIECNTTFLHGRDRFEAGDIRTVDDELGAYFIGHGWAAPLGSAPVAPAAGDVTLDIQDGVHTSQVDHG